MSDKTTEIDTLIITDETKHTLLRTGTKSAVAAT